MDKNDVKQAIREAHKENQKDAIDDIDNLIWLYIVPIGIGIYLYTKYFS